jgi:predicted O-methyltransferase YrrM
MFENLVWRKDRMLMDGLTFRLEHFASDDWELGDECFIFFKIKELVDQYESFFAPRKNFRPQNIFELGLWDGGSLAFWFETFHPNKQVGIDLTQREDSKYFRRYLEERGLGERLKSYWGVNQADKQMLREIVAREFDAPLDLVIDDASHLYGPTRSSFDCLFPLLRPGGLYIIEDWAWEHWKGFDSPDHPWAQEKGLTELVFELIQATGTSPTLIKSVTTYQGFTVVERGEADLNDVENFKLEHHFWRRPTPHISDGLVKD